MAPGADESDCVTPALAGNIGPLRGMLMSLIEQRVLRAGKSMPWWNLKVLERPVRRDAAAGSAVQKSEFHQIRLVHFLNRVRLLID